MPGKVNPVIPEVMSQAAFCIIGNDMCITMAAEAGQLELNFAEPVLYHKLFESIVALTGAVHTFTVNCVSGITANEERCRELMENSIGLITALNPYIGYENATRIAKIALESGRGVLELVREEKLLGDAELSDILRPENMIAPRLVPLQP
jgi:aspartate ammonia-lyase